MMFEKWIKCIDLKRSDAQSFNMESGHAGIA